MALGKSAAVVIGSFDLGESDRVVTFYSREHGKVRGVAKASRRMRSRFGGALELFTLGQLVFFGTGRSELVRVDHFDVLEPFAALRTDLERLGQAAWVVECVNRLTAERDPHAALRAPDALAAGADGRGHAAARDRLLRRARAGRARPPAAPGPLRGVRARLSVRAAVAGRGRRGVRAVRRPGAGCHPHQSGRGGRAGTPPRGALGGGAGPAARPRRDGAAGGAGSAHDTTDRPADAHREVPAGGAAAVRGDRRAVMSAVSMDVIVS